MDIQLTEEQRALGALVRRICTDLAPMDRVRALEDDPVGFDSELWTAFAAAGVLGLAVPGAYGGSEMSWLDTAVVYHEFGRALVPSPHFVSSVLGAGLLASAGSDEQRQRWLPPIVDGSAVLVPAWLEPGRSMRSTGIALAGTSTAQGYRLDGTKRHVAFAASADRLLVMFKTDAGPTLALVDPQEPGVKLTQTFSIASDTQYDVVFSAVEVREEDLVGAPGEGWSCWESTLRPALVALAAYAVGGAERALELTVDYAKTREQFGKPLGAFQALAHDMADSATAVSGAELLVHRGAADLDRGADSTTLAAMAKLFACETFRQVTRSGEQIFGGVGFTLEFDIQLFFRRAKQLEISWWGPAELEDDIAADLLPTG